MTTATTAETTRTVRAPRGAGRSRIAAVAYHGGMLAVVAIWVLPLIWVLSLSLSSNSALKLRSQTLLPQDLTLENYVGVFRVGLTSQWFVNSVVVTLLTTLVTVIICACAGYAFAKLSFPGRLAVYALTLAGMMVPKEAMFIPLFMMFEDMGLHNTYAGLILPRLAFPLGVFIMTQFFGQVPDEIEEAARVDGASAWRIFFSIMLPLARPSLLALATFTFVQSWNDYLWPLVSATRPEMFTITTGLASLQGNFAQATELGSLMARGVTGALPLLILFVVFQKHLIRGISMTSGDK
ncbi:MULTISPECIES: carbohydrate ABC transporter permease [unclassified Actinomyces]|uniref:carbohydrate ABC transporter permease n=1 Tax=unclassified Actinomyces TaxID=2609248 RepID=UPI0020183D14|nr:MULTISPECIES: carbohydrate ABC transporter permease [unclassified Actinomyces]MCL3778481.1 carbohydrate ABC transporter permease [Actinomyces sp. AC-20-1]MCL3790401.1 carbohydrate ABC transporter permease [Actinomyces sp. 187325]MCL3792628.1 carbohydrate ABC transporter permease [Actinomyces sp. 186855]MCL3793961.1 carbohydrate ABC transporter permease [Actinomyces sp. 217892]